MTVTRPVSRLVGPTGFTARFKMGDMRTEHAGAKNGGGWWGLRIVAKSKSKKVRRRHDKEESKIKEETYKY